MSDEHGSASMSRRGFFAATAGAAAATTAAAGAAADEHEDDEPADDQNGDADEPADDENGEADEPADDENGDADGLPGAGETETVMVGPGGDLVYDPEELFVLPGTTVEFIWDSDNHNLNVQSGPEDGWAGYDPLEDTGFEYEHTFEVEGEYEYVCDPHIGAGMEAEIIVTEDIPDDTGDGAGAAGPTAPEVPSAAMSLAIGTIAAMTSTLAIGYFFLKYGGTKEA